MTRETGNKVIELGNHRPWTDMACIKPENSKKIKFKFLLLVKCLFLTPRASDNGTNY